MDQEATKERNVGKADHSVCIWGLVLYCEEREFGHILHET